MSETPKPVKLELWAVPDSDGRWVGVVVPEGERPSDHGDSITYVVGAYRDIGFETPESVSYRVQRLLRNLGEGKVGR